MIINYNRFTVQVWFCGEWVSLGGAVRVSWEDAFAVEARKRLAGEQARVVDSSGRVVTGYRVPDAGSQAEVLL